jgi:hypothetical protein
LLTVTARLVLFVSSYAPRLALFAILDSFGRDGPSVVCASVAAGSLVALVVVWAMACVPVSEAEYPAAGVDT